MSQKSGCLKALGIGCLILILIVVVLAAVGYFKIVRPMMQVAQRIEQLKMQTEDAREALEELNLASTFSRPGEMANFEMGDQDVSRYIAVRTALAGPAAAAAAANEQMEGSMDFGDMGDKGPSIGMIFGKIGDVVGGVESTMTADLDLLTAAYPALQAQNMSPKELSALVEIVEWRFLGREELAHLGLEQEDRRRLQNNRTELMFEEMALSMAENPKFQMDPGEAERVRGEVERLHREIDELVEKAQANRGLHPSTRRVLQARSAELESLGGEGLELLSDLTEERLPMGIPADGNGWEPGG